MENLIKNQEEDIIANLIKTLPLIQATLPMDCMFAISDKEKFVYYLPGKEVDAKISIGNFIPHESGFYKCQQTGKKVVQVLSSDIYGTPTKSSSTPIKNKNGDIIGAIALGVSVNTQQILHNASETIASTSEEIGNTIEELANTSVKLSQDLDSLKDIGDAVISEIKKTSEILQFVNQIATSSNLLGLNAAIEAARAGEHGKGFTVVANEIRKMADNSVKSVKDINVILKSIETSVSNMVSTLSGVAEIGEQQASATEEISSSMEELTSSAMKIEKIAETAI
ncbi:methyl-accepting chemotaxis protein [Clostridium sp. A1-XYC3]|uniref:Methyl-accepting chemotaxis protein n=1 Tax=Clostridium tanneri TaxID=3037988 RepID=A0ABU4JTS7_9CLOT|nr:methyl-accepting chemotaxis protein [Clostridium sp. A1-XYC3]MDW8801511.1 methyl-accepting chemotaxis protein [Clostridium sp. A1-XYC3]